MNKVVMHANSNNYMAYEVPFDGQDVDWAKLGNKHKFSDDGEMCGMLMNAVYHAYYENIKQRDCKLSFSKIQDYMRDKTIGTVPIKDSFHQKVGTEIEQSGNLRNEVKQNLYFEPNTRQYEPSGIAGSKVNWEILTEWF